MKRSLVLISFVFLFLVVKAQNLVPNPNFEERTGCPSGYPDLDGICKDWMSFRGTPDYMNSCSSVCGYYNQYGYQEPHSDQAYAGFLTYQVTVPNGREHIGIQLSSTLIVGTKYYISFYISPSWNNLLTNIANNKIGALLTTYQYSDPGDGPLPNTCTIYTDSIMKDTLAWTKIFGSFIADSAYKYLVIGNFFDDSNTDTIILPYQVVPQIAYYYLDDVCLSTDSLYAQNWTDIKEHNNTNEILIYPNPSLDKIFLKADNKIEQIEIFNNLGKVVYVLKSRNENNLDLSLDFLSAGVYNLRIKTSKGYYNSKINILR